MRYWGFMATTLCESVSIWCWVTQNWQILPSSFGWVDSVSFCLLWQPVTSVRCVVNHRESTPRVWRPVLSPGFCAALVKVSNKKKIWMCLWGKPHKPHKLYTEMQSSEFQKESVRRHVGKLTILLYCRGKISVSRAGWKPLRRGLTLIGLILVLSIGSS